MKNLFFTLCLTSLICLPSRADDAAALSGKWSVKKVSKEGQNVTQTIEIKKDKFIFEILGSDNSVLIHAEGDLKFEKLGPFSVARFTNIRAGSSASSLQDVDDVYTSIYTLEDDAWTMASNFDKDRDGQKPSLDVYHHAKASGSAKKN